jgi:glycosyltransferase involved in cell wall biosynthesis
LERPRVSVITIFLDEERFLGEAIASVFAQAYAAWELLLVDDGSTDGGTELARACAAAHPDRVRYLEHPGHANRGMSASRNLGIAAARGEYLALLDADDVWLPDKLDRQVAILRQHRDAMMTYDETRYWYAWNREPGAEGLERLRRLGLPSGTLVQPPRLIPLFLSGDAETPGTCSVMIRREAFDRVGGFVESFRGIFEDQVFLFKVCLDLPVYLASGVTALYRQHPESSCQVAARMGLYDPEEGGPAQEVFIDWLASYLDRRLAAGDSEASRLPRETREYFRRRARRKRLPYVLIEMAKWVARRLLPPRILAALRARPWPPSR